MKKGLPTRPTGDRPKPRDAEREGTLTVNPRGFGFVASEGAAGDDVYVAREAMAGAMHGDRVRVQVTGRTTQGSEGVVVAVLDRSVVRVAGVLRRRGASAWIEPDDTRLRGPIVLTGDLDVRGADGNSGQDGDAVVGQLTRHPELAEENPEAMLVAVLGKPGELRVEVAKILTAKPISEVHSPEAFAEAEAFGGEVPVAMLEGREDLTHLPLPTIDPEDARDHDDAVWVERTDDDGYRAYIAIADVSAYVTPGTHLDEEARVRGCSVYLPDRAIPMLPRPLSSNLCSLLPGVLRLCLCVDVTLDDKGVVRGARLVRGFMKSQAKLTYGGVARALGFTDAPPRDPKAEELADGLRVAHELARRLRQRRMKRGALDLDLPEAVVVLNPQTGEPVDVLRRDRDKGTVKAYRLVEELMLLANEVVARELVRRDVPTIFRVHAPPDVKKLEKFGSLAEQLGIEFDVEATQDPKALSQLLASLEDHPSAKVLSSLLLRSMKQASYDPVNIGHFGLASKAYLHFTSPIRRYPDLVVHRAVHGVALSAPPQRTPEETNRIADAARAASLAERAAMDVEREVVDLYRTVLMKGRIGARYEGTVSAMVGSGAFVALDAPFVDVLVRFEDCGAERFELDDVGLAAVAKRSGETIRLGDRMTVEIIDAAVLRRTVYGRRVVTHAMREAYRPAKRPKPGAAGGRGKNNRKGKMGGRGKRR